MSADSQICADSVCIWDSADREVSARMATIFCALAGKLQRTPSEVQNLRHALGEDDESSEERMGAARSASSDSSSTIQKTSSQTIPDYPASDESEAAGYAQGVTNYDELSLRSGVPERTSFEVREHPHWHKHVTCLCLTGSDPCTD